VVGDVLDDEGKQVVDALGDRAVYCHLDVTSPADWESAMRTAEDAFGGLHVLVNNAGILKLISIEEMTLDEYMQVIQVNQVGTWLGMKASLPLMRASGGGSIVNLSSSAGLRGVRTGSAYCSSKWAVRGMSKVAALEFGQYGIRVNSVHPGAIATQMTGIEPGATGGPFAAYALPRVGLASEVAQLVLFLASDKSSYSTGGEYACDGGSTSGY
jgi:3alpha(or 20beta)-hydroxysteroid dehydrogenase